MNYSDMFFLILFKMLFELVLFKMFLNLPFKLLGMAPKDQPKVSSCDLI